MRRGYSMMMFPKKKQIRLKGKALADLVRKVFERDNHCCVVCGRWVEDGVKPHHACYKSRGGGDTIDNLVVLCNDCHFAVHHGKNSSEVKDKISEYLELVKSEI